MIKAKNYYFICDDVHDSIKDRAELDRVNVIPFGAGDIAGFILCDDCLGPVPEVEKFFNEISPNLREYRFKKRKKLRDWAGKRHIKVIQFSEMANGWFAGQEPQPGDKIRHCEECPESPVVFILRFGLNPLDLLQLEELEAEGEAVLASSEAPDYFLLCGCCYETLAPDDLISETDPEVFDPGMQEDLQGKVCLFMDFNTYHQRFQLRNIPSAPEIGDIVAACDHMIDEPEPPFHYWYVEKAGLKIEVEKNRRGRKKEKTIQWLQTCNQCNVIYSGAEAVFDNACKENFHIIWKEEDYEIFPIIPPDHEEGMTDN